MTADSSLLLTSNTVELPIVKLLIPTAAFFWLGPVLLGTLFIYFHLYLQRLWGTLARLPAILPDGASVDERVDPWLLNAFVRRRAPRLRGSSYARAPWLGFQDVLYQCAVWWLPPIALVPLWGRYLTRHDWFLSGVHIGIAILFLIAAGLRELAIATLEQSPRRVVGGWLSWRSATSGALVVAVLWSVSYAVVNGVTLKDEHSWIPKSISGVAQQMASVARADLRGVELWPRPKDWKADGWKANVPFSIVDLSWRDFRGAVFTKAFLAGANLQRAKLQGADLANSELGRANLRRANLDRTNLLMANLYGTNMSYAKVRNSELSWTNLRHANLSRADLTGSVLVGANLDGADFGEASLERARFVDAQQTARFGNAILSKTRLTDADLRGVNLESVRCLTKEQLSSARTDASTRRPAEFGPC